MSTNKVSGAKVVEFNREAFIKQHGTKSAAIRALLASGKTRGETAKMLGVIYQHVRNVQITPIKNAKVVTTYVAPIVDPLDAAAELLQEQLNKK